MRLAVARECDVTGKSVIWFSIGPFLRRAKDGPAGIRSHRRIMSAAGLDSMHAQH